MDQINPYALIDNLGTTEMIHRYKELTFKIELKRQHIKFNSICKTENLFPKYTNYKLPRHLTDSQINRIRMKHVNTEIKEHHKNIDSYNRTLNFIYHNLTRKLHYLELEEIINQAKTFKREDLTRLWKTKQKKINNLKERKNDILTNKANITRYSKSYKFHQKVTNLSNIQFSTDEWNLLNKGHKYAIKPQLQDTAKLAIDLEVAANKIPGEENLRKELIEILKKKEKEKVPDNQNNNNKQEINTLRKIKYKIRSNSLTITKADKNAGIVILDKNIYNSKTLEFFEQNNFVELNKNPTTAFHNKVKKQIKTSQEFLKEQNITIYNLIPMNPKIPLAYSLVKLHKQNLPIRPIISSLDSSTYKISKFLLQIFKNDIQFKPKYTIKNRNEIINTIKNTTLPVDYTILSFDITNLYTNIPITEALLLAKELIKDKFNDTNTEHIYNFLKLCTEQNFCQFDCKIYEYKKGLPMGSPLSGLLSDIFLNNLEKEILNTNNPNILLWRRYVDDVLIIWNNKDLDSIHSFYAYINGLHNDINFTMEIEEDNKLNFLDLTLTNNAKLITFDIYRKPTQTDSVIPKNSYHHKNHKAAAFWAFIYRYYNTPLSKESRNKELDIIHNIAKNNGYTESDIEYIIKKYNKKQQHLISTSLQQTNITKIYRSINYPGNIGYSIRKTFLKYNVNISFSNNNTLGKILINAKDKLQTLEQNGVYRLECDTCGATYIGETGRSLKQRIKEHKNNQNSNFGRHMIIHNHEFDINKNLTLLHKQNKGFKLNLLETYEIDKCRTKNQNIECLNDQIHTFKTPLYKSLINPFPIP
ncbi:HEAT repeat-containing protein 1 homolog [Onthophagus taurus]|uniref:HEAT repeat-containing protein 1 homolog n=1 Tax=Onthophagus taurus TaxID=166361 RepID=UPI0039BDB021